MHGLRRGMALGTAALLTGIGLVVGAPPIPPASAAPIGSIVIDGNTAGPNDWDALPPNLLDSDTRADACGKGGGLDPTQLDGKLDALKVNNPNPTPGNVVGKGDFCRVWRAVEAVPDSAGNLDMVLYGAWLRDFNKGEVTGYWPVLGPDPSSKTDDYLISFGDSADGAGVAVLDWNGSSWASIGTLAATVFESKLDSKDPLFGEFALNLSDAGLWPSSGSGQCTPYSSDYVITRTGNSQNAELQDYVGLAPYLISPCGELVVRKETVPEAPAPPVEFGYTLSRASTTIKSGPLVVPTAPSDTISPIPGGTNYSLSEAAPPAGWTLQSIECTVLDPVTGATRTITSTTSPLGVFPVTPGFTTECVITNVGPPPNLPPTLTIIKQTTSPAGTTPFPFGYAVNPPSTPQNFVLQDGGSQSIPVLVGDTVRISELVPPAPGWLLQSIQCVGDAEWTSDAATGTATVQVDQGEQIECVFINTQVETTPTQAFLIVRKVVQGTTATARFPFTVAGGPTRVDLFLEPPMTRLQVVTVTPAPGGTPYTVTEAVTEAVPAGWLLTGRTCVPPTGGTFTPVEPAGITVTLKPGETAVCTFTNEPAPLPPPPAKLTVEKITVPAGGTGFPFALRGLSPADDFTLADTGTKLFDQLEPGEYEVIEDVPSGWAATGSCVDSGGASVATVADGRVTVDLKSGEDVTCTFTNTKQVSLSLTKVAQPQSPQDFAFVVTTPAQIEVPVLLDDDGDATNDPENGQLSNTITGSELRPGTYIIEETPVPAGWALTSLICTGTPADSVVVVTTSPSVSITLDPGESAACTYTNTWIAPATLTLVKDVELATNPPGSAIDTQWTLSATGPTLGVTGTEGVPEITDRPVEAGTYTLAESGGPTGYVFSSLACRTTGGADKGATVTNPSVVLAAGEIVTCTFTNSEPQITVVKTAYYAADTGFANPIADESAVARGSSIVWRYLVTNTGRVPLTGVNVTDTFTRTPPGSPATGTVPVNCPGGNPIPSIAVGASVTCSGAGTM